MAAEYPIALEQGATYRDSFTYGVAQLDASGSPVLDANGAPVLARAYDLTGCKARMQIRQDYGKPVLVQITTEDGGITLGGESGLVELFISDEKTDLMALPNGKPVTAARYDLELEWPSGDVVRVLQGPVTCDPNVTRELVTE
jgi:hypothetical protein